MNVVLENFIGDLITIILPITIIVWSIWNKFVDLDEEIKELKNKIDELNKEIKVIENKED